MNTFTLNNGLQIPAIGFGTYKASLEAMTLAINDGVKYFDTASIYGTESALADAIKLSGMKRENLFVASKVWKSDLGYDATRAAFFKTLENLRTDYLDAYFIHWPRPDLEREDWKELDVETWRAMEEFYKQKKIRAIGLSNFLPHHAENIFAHCEIGPQIAQLEFHAGYTQTFALNYYREKNILVQAWSSTARGRIFNDDLICELSEKYHASKAQICIAFCLAENVMPLVKASSSERIQENFASEKISLSPEDISRLESMPPCGWSGEHPDRPRVKI